MFVFFFPKFYNLLFNIKSDVTLVTSPLFPNLSAKMDIVKQYIPCILVLSNYPDVGTTLDEICCFC